MMRDFVSIVTALAFPPAMPSVVIGNGPQLTVNNNGGGGGFIPSLVFSLSPNVHITIYSNSWDGAIVIPDYTGGTVVIGPFCLHLTITNAGVSTRYFREYNTLDSSWEWVTDYGTPERRNLQAFDRMISEMLPYIST